MKASKVFQELPLPSTKPCHIFLNGNVVDKNIQKKKNQKSTNKKEKSTKSLVLQHDIETLAEKMCSSCGKLFDTTPQLLQHKADEHPLNSPLGKSTLSINNLPKAVNDFLHPLFEHDPDSPSQQENSRRPKRVRKLAKKFKHECPTCLKTFITPSKLKRHTKMHTKSKPFCCNHCGKEFTRSDNLSTHIFSVHEKQRINECQYCKEKFSSKQGLSYHELGCKNNRLLHKNDNLRFFCGFCNRGFAFKNSLCSHVKKQHLSSNTSYLCMRCDKDFFNISHLRRHISSVHKKQKPFSCAHCPHRCALKANLVLHYLAKHAKN